MQPSPPALPHGQRDGNVPGTQGDADSLESRLVLGLSRGSPSPSAAPSRHPTNPAVPRILVPFTFTVSSRCPKTVHAA